MSEYALNPCPFCSEHLLYQEDNHGHWYEHRYVTGPCMVSTVQVTDAQDARAWNTRPIESALEQENANLSGELCKLRSDLATAMNKANELGDKLATRIEEIEKLRARVERLTKALKNCACFCTGLAFGIKCLRCEALQNCEENDEG